MPDIPAYSSIADQVRITVHPIYLESQSSPTENQYLWAYHIRIENLGEEIIQLKARHWEITDSLGRTQEVDGGGVVGEQPVLEPGEAFEYTSGAPLSTPSGIMVGHYQMAKNDGEEFKVDIPTFSLDSPYEAPTLH